MTHLARRGIAYSLGYIDLAIAKSSASRVCHKSEELPPNEI